MHGSSVESDWRYTALCIPDTNISGPENYHLILLLATRHALESVDPQRDLSICGDDRNDALAASHRGRVISAMACFKRSKDRWVRLNVDLAFT